MTQTVIKNLPSQHDIMRRSNGNWQQPLVSFLCTTYNQQSYLEQTIQGFLLQKVDFPYEIVIHDDHSNDGTQDIINHYQAQYPQLINCIMQQENQYSQGKSTIAIALTQCKGTYIALCEGDDYWINEHKIAQQTQIMLNDAAVSMVVSPGRLEDNGRLLTKLHCYYGAQNKVITAQQVIDEPWQFAPTASYLIKKEHLHAARALFINAPVSDTFIEVYAATVGKLIYHPLVGSVYRMTAKNSWSERMSVNHDNTQAIQRTEQFVHRMQKAIKHTKTQAGCESLDWSRKLAAMHYILAVLYLKNKDLTQFSSTITTSYHYGKVAKQQQFLYYTKGVMGALWGLIKPATYIRSQVRRLLAPR